MFPTSDVMARIGKDARDYDVQERGLYSTVGRDLEFGRKGKTRN